MVVLLCGGWLEHAGRGGGGRQVGGFFTCCSGERSGTPGRVLLLFLRCCTDMLLLLRQLYGKGHPQTPQTPLVGALVGVGREECARWA